MQDASGELSNAPRVSIATACAVIVAMLAGIVAIGWLLRNTGLGMATIAPPAGAITYVTATDNMGTDVWQRSWVVLPVAAWREAAPVFASAIENSGAGTGASGLEIKLEAGPARFTVLPSWSGDSPYFLVNDDLDARNSKRYVPLDPVAYRAACEKLLAAVKAAPPQPKPLDRLQELMNAQQKKSGEATGAATPETPPSAESPRTPTPTGPAVAE